MLRKNSGSQDYALVGEAGCKLHEAKQNKAPILDMGHLFAQGGTTVEGDKVREL